MTTTLVVDCAGDAPGSATRRWLAVHAADDVLVGAAALALARGTRRARVRVADDAAEAALRAAVRRWQVDVEVARVAAAWPAPAASISAAVAAQIAAELAGRGDVRHVSVVGAVREPRVLAARATDSLAALVAAAGGASTPAWLALCGDDLGGRAAGGDDRAGSVGEVLWILPPAHALVRALRTPTGEWLRRAASVCEGCAACSEACPAHRDGAQLAPHAILRSLVADRPRGLADLWACTECGLCDAVCPSQVAPRRVLAALRGGFDGETLAAAQRLEAATRARRAKQAPRVPAVPPDAPRPAGLDTALLAARLGLGAFPAPAV